MAARYLHQNKATNHATATPVTPVVASSFATNHTRAATSSHVGQLKDTATGLTITRQPTALVKPTAVSLYATSASSAAAAPTKFSSVEAAARDWGETYNQPSIAANQEYGSTIYQNPDGTYSYSVPYTQGSAITTRFSPPPNGQPPVGKIHSHGAYIASYGTGNDHFSQNDMAIAKANGLANYLTDPCGELLFYDVGTGNEVLIMNTLPSDRNDPCSP